MSKERYISKEEYKEYEKYKKDKRQGRLLNPEGLMFLAESVDYDPARLGMIMLDNIEKFKAVDPYLKVFSDVKLIFDPVSEDNTDQEDFLPFIEYKK